MSIDPRSSPLVLETLVDTYLFTPPGPSGTFSKEEASQPDVDVKMDMEKLKDYYPREIYMTEEHATEVFRVRGRRVSRGGEALQKSLFFAIVPVF